MVRRSRLKSRLKSNQHLCFNFPLRAVLLEEALTITIFVDSSLMVFTTSSYCVRDIFLYFIPVQKHYEWTTYLSTFGYLASDNCSSLTYCICINNACIYLFMEWQPILQSFIWIKLLERCIWKVRMQNQSTCPHWPNTHHINMAVR